MSYRDEWDLEPDKEGLARTNAILNMQDRINYMQTLIAKGSVLSMLNMAHFYEHLGREFSGPDMASAEKWYKEAVLAGSGIATYELGRFLVRAKRYDEAIDALKIGVERDYAPSIVRLSAFYTTRCSRRCRFEPSAGFGMGRSEFAKMKARRCARLDSHGSVADRRVAQIGIGVNILKLIARNDRPMTLPSALHRHARTATSRQRASS